MHYGALGMSATNPTAGTSNYAHAISNRRVQLDYVLLSKFCTIWIFVSTSSKYVLACGVAL